MTVISQKLTTFICRIVNNFYNHRFRLEVCRMKSAISHHTTYYQEEGTFNELKIYQYFQVLQRQGYSSTFIEADFQQARVELESESDINEVNHV